jgi:hypothetical protein
MHAAAAMLVLWVSGANPFLDEGRRLYDGMLYEKATAQLRLAAETPTSTKEERRQAVDLLARSLAAQGLIDQAEREYARLLDRDPNAPAPADASPKIRAAFQRAKARLYPADFVSLSQVAATTASVEVDVVDPWQKVRELTLASSQGGAAFEKQQMEYKDGRAGGRFGPLGDAPVRYYVLAQGEQERVLARLGSEEKPLLLPRPEVSTATDETHVPSEAIVTRRIEPAPPPSRTPAWVLGGAAVAAAIAGTALAVSSNQDVQAAHGAWGSDVKALNDSARSKALAANISFGGTILFGVGATYAALRGP